MTGWNCYCYSSWFDWVVLLDSISSSQSSVGIHVSHYPPAYNTNRFRIGKHRIANSGRSPFLIDPDVSSGVYDRRELEPRPFFADHHEDRGQSSLILC